MRHLILALSLAMAYWLIGCTTVNIRTDATVGANTSHAIVDGSAYAQVEASSLATSSTAASTAGRSHPVSNNIVDTARILGASALAAGVLSGNAPLTGIGAGTLAGSLIPTKAKK